MSRKKMFILTNDRVLRSRGEKTLKRERSVKGSSYNQENVNSFKEVNTLEEKKMDFGGRSSQGDQVSDNQQPLDNRQPRQPTTPG